MKDNIKVANFWNFFKSEGVKRHFTVKKTPQQNRATERMNRTLTECERCMRIHVGLPKAFWAAAVNHTSYLVNRSSSKYLDFKCAKEIWSNESIEYTNLKVFGCSAYALIPSDERTKLKPKYFGCIFLDFESSVKDFKSWDPVNRKKILSRDVVFDENTMPIIKVKKP
ncbi:PREDICTED: Retrovirus-related Pol poly from [Prunus dulcis]|uniref:PREDICTED: Retrovirus-related Pol poly from n=1 Tax=Prunus dulcis TaxID=3755 RepID=A0A5E4F298_PRUDU|nr:PREDICTED: Retrovirus-related Pol poly from [Prunus dulcis]